MSDSISSTDAGKYIQCTQQQPLLPISPHQVHLAVLAKWKADWNNHRTYSSRLKQLWHSAEPYSDILVSTCNFQTADNIAGFALFFLKHQGPT